MQTRRLIFEKLCADHARGLFEELCDARVYEQIGDLPASSIAELASDFSRRASGPPPNRDLERWVNYALRLQDDGRLIGRVEATLLGQRAEVAYLLGFRYWGQGYAFEAMSEFQSHLRKEADVTEFWATTLPQNMRSIQLLLRLGYRQIFNEWPLLQSYDRGDLVFVL